MYPQSSGSSTLLLTINDRAVINFEGGFCLARYTSMDPEKHDRLLRCAIALFAEKGLNNVSVEDITKGTGLAKGTFYLYFKNREALLGEVCEHCFALSLRHSMKGVDEEITYSEKLKKRVHNIILFSQHHPVESLVLSQLYRPVNVVGTENLLHSPSYDINRDFIRRGIEAGEFVSLPLELLCQLFFSGVEGLSTYVRKKPDLLADPVLTNQALERLIQLLR